jgi:signal transduction histidine kinase
MGSQERDIFIALMIIAFLLALIVSYFFYQLYRQQQVLNKFKHEKNKSEIISSELERNEISVELHNDISPYLASVKMRLSMMDDKRNEILKGCIPVIDLCIDRIRVMSKRMAPLSEYEQSFMSGLQRFVDKTGLDKGIEFQLQERERVELSDDQINQVYRILQEIVLNTIKHSNASQLKIESSKDGNYLLIRTSDNGIGFDMDKIKATQSYGLGLLKMQSRVDYLNGMLVKDNSSIGGTRYNIRIPLQNDLYEAN